MIAILAVTLGIVIGWARGGRLRNLEQLHIRMGGAALGLFLGQLLLRGAIPLPLPISGQTRVVIWCAFAIVLMVVVVLNISVPGMQFVAVGLLLNVVVVATNSGMPLSYSATVGLGATTEQIARSLSTGFYRLVDESTVFAFMGDVIPVPGPAGLRSVVSVGDLLMVFGVAIVASQGMLGRSEISDRASETP